MPNNELQCLYTTAHDVTKHYSMFVNRQRTIVVTVSTLAIAACGKLYLDDNPSYLAIIAIAGWGFFFVASMFFLMRHYRAHALSSMKAAAEFEERLHEHANVTEGAWKGVTKNVESLEKRFFVRLCYVYGTFAVMETAFFVIFVFAACNLNDPSKVTKEDLSQARSVAELIIVGSNNAGHEDVVSECPELKLVKMLKEGEIQGIVKVHCGGVKLRNAYMETFDLQYVNRGSLVSFHAKKPNSDDRSERTAMIFPVSPEEGATRADRLTGIREAIDELRIFITEPIHVGLLSLCRSGTSKDWTYDAESRRSDEDAAWIKDQLEGSSTGITAKNHGIELEEALQESDIISPFRGGYGGLLYRTLTFLGTAREIASPSFTSLPYVGGCDG